MYDFPKKESPSRTYVAMCNSSNFDGFYFKKFVLPETMRAYSFEDGYFDTPCRNDTEFAAWYFLNRMNLSACVKKVITFEDYSDLSDQE